jgi:hypothetical protein
MEMVPQAIAIMVKVILFRCFFKSRKNNLKIKRPCTCFLPHVISIVAAGFSLRLVFTHPEGAVEKPVIEELDFVGTGLVLQDESFRMNLCPNSKEDSHTSC